MATSRRSKTATAGVAKRPSTTKRRRIDMVNLLIGGAVTLLAGLLALISVHLVAGNDTHAIVWYLPWLPIVVGLGLLGWALGRVGSGSKKSQASEALEPR